MGAKTGISWAHHTFNPWWGCQRVSAGCQHCYAETLTTRLGYDLWGAAKTTPRRFFADAHWREPLRWNAAAQKAGERRRVFSGSMCDVFEDHPDLRWHRERLFELIVATPNLDWLQLTKRPENIATMLPDWWSGAEHGRNVWLGTSVEDQATARARIPHLRRSGPECARLFLSCEPLLGPLDLASLHESVDERGERYATRVSSLALIDWVIVGGESGRDRRPFYLSWARDIKAQCEGYGTAFFFKQTTSFRPGSLDGVPDDLLVQEVPQ